MFNPKDRQGGAAAASWDFFFFFLWGGGSLNHICCYTIVFHVGAITLRNIA